VACLSAAETPSRRTRSTSSAGIVTRRPNRATRTRPCSAKRYAVRLETPQTTAAAGRLRFGKRALSGGNQPRTSHALARSLWKPLAEKAGPSA
jgi:hypothetical protein